MSASDPVRFKYTRTERTGTDADIPDLLASCYPLLTS
jgi:hypothetical protein